MKNYLLNKSIILILCSFLLSFVFSLTSCDEDGSTDCELFGDCDTYDGNTGGGSSSIKLTIWSDFYGPPIEVYVNNSYKGSITSYYSSETPNCGTSGCVTLTFTTSTYISYYATDGDYVWENNSFYVPNNLCNTLRLKQ